MHMQASAAPETSTSSPTNLNDITFQRALLLWGVVVVWLGIARNELFLAVVFYLRYRLPFVLVSGCGRAYSIFPVQRMCV